MYGINSNDQFSKIVYIAVLQDSNDNYYSGVITNIDKLAKYGGNVDIMQGLCREKTVYILKIKGEECK